MKHYLLFANQLYSYAILRPLQEAIRARGDDVAWFIQDIPNMLTALDAPILENVKAVQEYNPIAVFVPTNWVPDFFPGVKVEIFHGFNVGKRANTNQDHFRIRGHFDLYCTQGPDTTIPFKSLAEKHGYFRVSETGWSKLDPMFNYENKNEFRKKLKTDKKIIFYASTFSPKLTSAPYVAEKIKEISQSGIWHWVITLHPKTEPSIIDMYRKMQNENLTFIEPGEDIIPILYAADAMLCDTSSIFIEYLLLNKPVVTFKTSAPGPHLINIHELNEIENALTYALSRPETLMNEIENYCQKIHPNRDGHASERILRATDEFITLDKSVLAKKPLNILRKLQIRKKFNYFKI